MQEHDRGSIIIPLLLVGLNIVGFNQPIELWFQNCLGSTIVSVCVVLARSNHVLMNYSMSEDHRANLHPIVMDGER